MKNLTQEQWKDSLEKDDNAEILDVRTEEEFIEGYIPDAKNIDIYKGQGFIDEITNLIKKELLCLLQVRCKKCAGMCHL
jgi:rhodanese-related sulfurtransferase